MSKGGSEKSRYKWERQVWQRRESGKAERVKARTNEGEDAGKGGRRTKRELRWRWK